MDGDRFDALSRSLAARSSRRGGLRLFVAGGAAGGLLAAAERSTAAVSTNCALTILATTAVGPNMNTAYAGTLMFTIGDTGAIDSGSFDTNDGASHPLVGQATGRALILRITLADNSVLELNGTAELDLVLCRGAASGTFGGPGDGDLGAWRTVDGAATGGSSGGNSGTTTSDGSNSAGSSGGSGDTTGETPSGGGAGGAACASGVVCGGQCCVGLAGFTPDQMSCDGNSCSCAYSCQAAGCPNGGTNHSFTIGCDARPDALCGENCNFPADTGCGGMTCNAGETLDVGTCTCAGANPGAACPGTTNCGTAAAPVCADTLTDSNHCGGCEVQCPAGKECVSSACENACPAGQTRCGAGLCVDPQSDALNCGACGTACSVDLFCSGGVCTCTFGRMLCNTAGGGQACFDLQGDPNNCGGCGVPCLPFEDCNAGFCSSKCGAAGLATCRDGCADLTTDNNNCGACGMVCPAGTNCHNQVCA